MSQLFNKHPFQQASKKGKNVKAILVVVCRPPSNLIPFEKPFPFPSPGGSSPASMGGWGCIFLNSIFLNSGGL